ncbi:MAG TPA: efflux RND transporter periplasmic adaptor subunit [Syntrophales bacterium]|nr:efflux RND transporter periplasmic adaptor subunit [Syntrophales bacterium]
MKKIYIIAAAFLCLSVAFLAGYWSKAPDAPKTGATALQMTADPAGPSSQAPGMVRVSPDRQQLVGVRLATVEKVPETHTLRLLGRVATDETRIYQIIAPVDGWIRDTYNNSTGTLVKKDEPLASFYSPEFLSAQQAYFYALNSLDRFEASENETPGQISQTKANIQQYSDALRNLGMGDKQIEEIGKTRKRTQNIQITAPTAGFILARNVSPGRKFSRGTELFKIADLRRIWILADLFENEADYVKPGKIVKVTLPNQKKVLQARVSGVLPQFDPATRTLKVRLETDNPGYVLRPDMFVDVELPVTFPPAIAVPADAILDSGLKKTVFVDRGNGYFEPREVETGWRFANRVEIVKGLEPGEKIVVSGNFLIDSESRMELAAAGMSGSLVKDPACGAFVSVKKAEKAGRSSIHQGKTYYFSSAECKDKFDRDPDRYAAKPVEGND